MTPDTESSPPDGDALRRALVALKDMKARVDRAEAAAHEPIAIVGVGCRFPGASSPREFWDLLSSGGDAVGPVPRDRWNHDEYYDPDPDAPGKMANDAGGFVDWPVDRFDASFFGIAPIEARDLDPQHRLLLEVTWETFEHAGIDPASMVGSSTGVWVGISCTDYANLQGAGGGDAVGPYFGTGVAQSVAAGRVAYNFGLRGPTMAVDTACSSSLVAMLSAVDSLRAGNCDAALAGGVHLMLQPESMLVLSKLRALSPTGRCRTFSEAADGYARSEGCGMVLMKRLSDAERDGDRILSVIRGGAVNHDGRSSGLTVPNGSAQRDVLALALEKSQLGPSDVHYLEAHGTGTPLGDPIELRAVDHVYGRNRTGDPLVVGSVKTNIGHLEAAAGVAGVIKLALALHHESVPSHLHADELTSHVDWDAMEIEVAHNARPWTRSDHVRRGAVSAFGLSGTNAHLIMEEAPRASLNESEQVDSFPMVLPMSARSDQAVTQLARDYAGLIAASGIDADDVAASARRRATFESRLVVVGDSGPELAGRLGSWLNDGDSVGVVAGETVTTPSLAFAFTGQGAQYLGMAASLYATSEVFRGAFDRCADLIDPHLPVSVRVAIREDSTEASIDDTTYTQPAIFAVQFALAELWRSWGAEPAAVVGHSIGEYAAAVVAGVLDLESAARLIATRSTLMGSLPAGGAMHAVFAGADVVEPLIADHPDLAIAAYNGVTSVVISGAESAVENVAAQLAASGIEGRPLTVSHAFHSPLMAPMLEDFAAVAGDMSFSEPSIPFVSTVEGGPTTAASDATYWVNHISAPVRFAGAIDELLDLGVTDIVEIGPDPVLSAMILRDHPDVGVHPSLRSQIDDSLQMATTLGRLWVRGHDVQLDTGRRGKQVATPAYPYERQRFWAPVEAEESANGPRMHPLLHEELSSPAISGRAFQGRLGSRQPAYLADHLVFDTTIVPASGQIEMVLAAAGEMLGTTTITLSSVSFHEMLVLPEGPRRSVQVVLDEPIEGRMSFSVFSQTGTSWQRHSSGVIELDPGPAPNAAPSDLTGESIDLDEFYAAVDALGVNYGPAFRVLEQLHVTDFGVTGDLALQEDADIRAASDYVAHPALLDGCFQMLGALHADLTADGDVVYLPIGFDRFQVFGPIGSRCRALATHAEGGGSQFALADLSIYDADGQLLAHVAGMKLARVSQADVRAQTARAISAAGGSAGDRWLHGVDWVPAAAPVVEQGDGHWLMIGGDVAREIRSHIKELGHRATVVGDDPADLVDIPTPAGGWSGIVCTAPADNLGQSRQSIVEPALETARVLIDLLRGDASILAPDARLWFVTKGSSVAADTTPDIDQAMVAGLVNTLSTEEPSLRSAHLDLDSTGTSAAVPFIVGFSAEDRLAIRGNQAFVPRLVPETTTTAEPAEFSTGRTVLITGGLGGLGLVAARFAVESGAEQVALVSRRSPDEAVQAEIDALIELGASVRTYSADVSSREEVAGLLARVESEQAPIGGVIHTAGVLDDALVRNQTWDRFQRVAAAKLDGALHLDELTADKELDFFVLYGSAASIIGSAGQSNYAAANAGLDALAARRRANGLPAVSIAWGPWSGVGMAARQGEAPDLPGTRLIDPDIGQGLLGRSLSGPRSQLAVLPFDWRILSSTGTAELRRPYFEMVYDPSNDSGGGGAAFREELAGLDDDQQVAILRSRISEIVAAVLGLPPDAIAADQPFTELGLDSLMAVEVANRIQRVMGVTPASTVAFEFPTSDELAEHIATDLLTLSAEDPSLDAGTKSGGSTTRRETATRPALMRIARPDDIVASAAQNRLLFIDQFEPGLPIYNLSTAARLSGTVRVDAIQAALDHIVRRHEPLRTDFEKVDGIFYQRVTDPVPAPITVEDWRDRELDGDAGVTERIHEFTALPFDLATGLKIRALLLQVADDVFYFTCVMHHIASDGWSLTRVIAEFTEVYQATVRGMPVKLEELPIAYIDYAAWLQQCIDTGAIDGPLDYWREQLSGELPVLAFPTDMARPAARTYGGGNHHFTVPAELEAAARRYSASIGSTLFMTLYASYVAALARYTGQDEIIVGTAAANRAQPETEQLVAFLANTLALRINVDLEADFRTLVDEAKRVLLDATANQDAPFDRVVAEVSPPRDLSRPPIFQTMFLLMNMHMPSVELDGTRLERVEIGNRSVDYDLGVELIEFEGDLLGLVRYNTGLFEDESIAQFTEHWLNLLTAAVGGSDLPIGSLPLTSEDDAAIALVDPRSEFDLDRKLHDLVSEQASRVPDKIAVIAGDDRLTYADLDSQSTRLARHLMAIGVSPNDFVGVVADRSMEMVVALLGVLKAGAAYLPLDPAYPTDRLAHMISDSGARTVIDTQRQLSQVVDLSHLSVVDPAGDQAEIDQHSSDPVPPTSGDLTYIIYTSGSTGKPKGVVLQHRNVVNFLRTMQEEPGLDENDVLLAVTTLSFDISVLELFLPLITGATVVMASAAAVGDGPRLGGLIDASQATVMQATPVTWTLLFDGGWPGRADLRVLSGGEALSRTLADRLLDTCGPVWNMFGPTETTVWSTIHRVEPGLDAVPIGRPIANTVCEIVEPSGARAPVGVLGELLIGGEGVARGYHQRFELTAERFIPDPNRPGQRLYRTGDLARRRRDGAIEFLGRMDHQVKVRGHRIELGEIEAGLRAGPHASDAVVVAHGTGNDARLVAYVIPADPSVTPVTADLRAGLQKRVPEYMVPSLFVMLDEFPLTPNKKIDRNALPHPDDLDRAATSVFVEPETDGEWVVASLFASTLSVDTVGAIDNFFERGGHSLQATMVLAKLANVFGHEVDLRDFFADPSPRGVCAALHAIDGDPARIEQIATVERKVLSMDMDELESALIDTSPDGDGHRQ